MVSFLIYQTIGIAAVGVAVKVGHLVQIGQTGTDARGLPSLTIVKIVTRSGAEAETGTDALESGMIGGGTEDVGEDIPINCACLSFVVTAL
ncbi:hypothetical protein A0H81_09767 [Grifola frondosa]|uniref:Uncharacterized protein n=1 Tax=Grifola frondosa TaxID=5627 RepID=A0A1C7M279_GRIFR|nr:hypothetical protein A0H81_09767 [Grifola frondosa]